MKRARQKILQFCGFFICRTEPLTAGREKRGWCPCVEEPQGHKGGEGRRPCVSMVGAGGGLVDQEAVGRDALQTSENRPHRGGRAGAERVSGSLFSPVAPSSGESCSCLSRAYPRPTRPPRPCCPALSVQGLIT